VKENREAQVLRREEQRIKHKALPVDYPPSQPVGSGFEPHWRPQPAKLPSYDSDTAMKPYLTMMVGQVTPG